VEGWPLTACGFDSRLMAHVDQPKRIVSASERLGLGARPDSVEIGLFDK
jgi:hypothetical protein